MSVVAKEYGVTEATRPRLWRKRRQEATPYRECAHPPAFERDTVPLNDLLTELFPAQEAVMTDFDQWKSTLVMRADILGGEAVFPKSRLAVRHVGEKARRGVSDDEIVADYPNLSKQDVEFARRFVAEIPSR